jgi:hypothetical protein
LVFSNLARVLLTQNVRHCQREILFSSETSDHVMRSRNCSLLEATSQKSPFLSLYSGQESGWSGLVVLGHRENSPPCVDPSQSLLHFFPVYLINHQVRHWPTPTDDWLFETSARAKDCTCQVAIKFTKSIPWGGKFSVELRSSTTF